MKNQLIFFCFLSSLWGQPTSWEIWKQKTLQDLTKIPGWCSQEKAEKIMDLIHETRPVQCVEIGAFAGATTFPIVRALNFLNQGTLYAIDAWDHQICLEGLEPDDPYIEWWLNLKTDMDLIYQYFLSWVFSSQLRNQCFPIRLRSEKAVSLFPDQSIDFLYIDGNMSKEGSLQDVKLYLPKMKNGGFIWLNLADSLNKNQAVSFLMKNCEWIREKSLGIHCVLFRKNKDAF